MRSLALLKLSFLEDKDDVLDHFVLLVKLMQICNLSTLVAIIGNR